MDSRRIIACSNCNGDLRDRMKHIGVMMSFAPIPCPRCGNLTMVLDTYEPKNPTLENYEEPEFIGCTLKQLPDDMLIPAAIMAAEINPVNRPDPLRVLDVIRNLVGGAECEAPTPLQIAVLTTKYWGAGGVRLTVGFMEQQSEAFKSKILLYMNKWGANGRSNIVFVLSQTDPQVRISTGPGGYYSYLGTDVRSIPKNQQTMNLERFTLNTPDSEYDRVVTHETGHTLGFPHEHMRLALVQLLDEQKTIAYFGRTQGWSAQQVRQQVLTPLSEVSLMSTPPDQDSDMCYQIPGQCTKSGQPIRGGAGINASDAAFAARIYPLAVPPPPPVGVFRYLVESPADITFTRQ